MQMRRTTRGISVFHAMLLFGIIRTLHLSHQRKISQSCCFASATSSPGGQDVAATSATRVAPSLRRIQVQIVHRHGDRSPITPLKDEEYWRKQLVDDTTLQKISSNTKLVEPNSADKKHVANGRGPFGKLTELGLLQMVKLGSRLKETLEGPRNEETIDATGTHLFLNIFDEDQPLSTRNISVLSTNFQRTIQSVQGVLVGLFPDSINETIKIDTRNTDWMIPDPHPRRTLEQAQLEQKLSNQGHFLARELELYPLATRATSALHPILASDAREANFGVEQTEVMLDGDSSIEVQPLSWNQLAEITKCLAIRDMLPEGITKNDQEQILSHAAWRWFQTFSDKRLARLAMGTMVDSMISSMINHTGETAVKIWSAHDSTLICLLCAFRLEQPAVWPEYGSYLMIELFESLDNDELFVRFSLNGMFLKCRAGGELSMFTELSSLEKQLRDTSTETSMA